MLTCAIEHTGTKKNRVRKQPISNHTIVGTETSGGGSTTRKMEFTIPHSTVNEELSTMVKQHAKMVKRHARVVAKRQKLKRNICIWN